MEINSKTRTSERNIYHMQNQREPQGGHCKQNRAINFSKLELFFIPDHQTLLVASNIFIFWPPTGGCLTPIVPCYQAQVHRKLGISLPGNVQMTWNRKLEQKMQFPEFQQLIHSNVWFELSFYLEERRKSLSVSKIKTVRGTASQTVQTWMKHQVETAKILTLG